MKNFIINILNKFFAQLNYVASLVDGTEVHSPCKYCGGSTRFTGINGESSTCNVCQRKQ